jgi:hypothetical protein
MTGAESGKLYALLELTSLYFCLAPMYKFGSNAKPGFRPRLPGRLVWKHSAYVALIKFITFRQSVRF